MPDRTETRILFKPLDIRSFRLRNRIVMPAMATNRDIAADEGVSWYREHAAGGVALVIVEATCVERFGQGLTAERLRPLCSAVHDAGALIAIQLFPVMFGSGVTPADLDRRQIEQIIRSYESAARVCAEAGFDGVEPHGAHGFLLNRFFSPVHNLRADEFGGDFEGHMRLGLEVSRAARRGLGPDRLLLYRHTPVMDGSYGLEESLRFAGRLVETGVDVLDISPASDRAPGDRAAPFRALGVPVIAVNEMDQVERAVETLREGRADLVAVGRGLIADPLWPIKVFEGREAEITRCTRCNEKCFGNLRRGEIVACIQW